MELERWILKVQHDCVNVLETIQTFWLILLLLLLLLLILLASWSLVNFNSSKIVLHCSRSCYLRLQFLTPLFFKSSSTDSSHLKLGFLKRRVPSGLRTVSLLQGSSPYILNSCPIHLNLPISITMYTECNVYEPTQFSRLCSWPMCPRSAHSTCTITASQKRIASKFTLMH